MGYPIFGPQVRWGTPFLVDFWTQFGANLAPSWATLVQELVLDGLVGLREAQRIRTPGPQPKIRTHNHSRRGPGDGRDHVILALAAASLRADERPSATKFTTETDEGPDRALLAAAPASSHHREPLV